MLKKLIIISSCLLSLGHTPGASAGKLQSEDRLLRPLPVHNLYPAMMHHYEPLPSSALDSYPEEFRLGILQHYTSVYLYDQLPEGRLLADMEIYTLEFNMDKAISDHTEIGFTLPLHYAWEGFLDGMLRRYHDTLGLPNSKRELRPDNEYAWQYSDPQSSGGWQDSAGWELGNAVLSLRHQLNRTHHDGLSLLTAIQLPTASSSRGWSSGHLDLGAGLVYSWRGASWFGHLESWIIFPFKNDKSDVEYNSYARGSFSLGWQWNKRLALLGQIQGGNSAFDTGLEQLDENPWQLSLGLNWLLAAGSMVNFSFVENITQQTTPDFTITLGLYFD